MKKLLNTDSYLVGAIATLVSELLCAGLLWIVLLATGTRIGHTSILLIRISAEGFRSTLPSSLCLPSLPDSPGR